jgi:hypothetical protein
MIVCSRLYDPAVYLDVMYRGAFDFIVYPYPADEVRGGFRQSVPQIF